MSVMAAAALDNELPQSPPEGVFRHRGLNSIPLERTKAIICRTDTVSLVEGPSEDDIDLQSGLKRQFYYPLILLAALNKSPGIERRVQSRTSAPAEETSTQILPAFINRVALLCQTKTGGDAVSACSVLKNPSGITYIFTSNSRKDFELEAIAADLTAILKMVSSRNDGDHDHASKLRQKILLNILALVKPRIKCYLNKLEEHLENCIASCQRGGGEKGIAEATPRPRTSRIGRSLLVLSLRDR